MSSAKTALSAIVSVALWSATAQAGAYRLPWAPGLSMELTQDCNDSSYADHVGSGKNAWDFANGTHFGVSAAREGVVTHLKMSSHAGCQSAACVDFANYIVVDHGDGTASVYLHLDGRSLSPDVRCGQRVRQGQAIAHAGSTGWATGPHLHFQVNTVHANDTDACECGEDGLACADKEAAWSSFWSTPRFPSVPVSFDEWPANECADRRILLPLSQNVEAPVDRRAVSVGRALAAVRKKAQGRPLVILGIGGRGWPGFPATDKSPLLFPEILQPSPPGPSVGLPPP